MNASWDSYVKSDWLHIYKQPFRWRGNSVHLNILLKGCCSIRLCRKTTFISVSVSMRTQSLSSLKCRQPVSILSDVTSWNPAAANRSPASSYYCLRPAFFSFFFFYSLFLSAQGEGEGKRGMPSTHADIITVIISFLISTKPWITALSSSFLGCQ